MNNAASSRRISAMLFLTLGVILSVFAGFALSQMFVIEQDSFQLISAVSSVMIVSFLRYQWRALPAVILGLFAYYFWTGRTLEHALLYAFTVPLLPFAFSSLFHYLNNRALYQPAEQRITLFFVVIGCLFPFANTIKMMLVNTFVDGQFLSPDFLFYATLGNYLTQLLVTPILYVMVSLLTDTDTQSYLALDKRLRVSNSRCRGYITWLVSCIAIFITAVLSSSSFMLNSLSFFAVLLVVIGLAKHGLIRPLFVGAPFILLIINDSISHYNAGLIGDKQFYGLLIIITVLTTLAYLLGGYSVKLFEMTQRQIRSERIDPYSGLSNIAQLKEDISRQRHSLLLYLDLTPTLSMLTDLGHEGKSQLIMQLSEFLYSRNDSINRCYRPPFSTGLLSFTHYSDLAEEELREVVEYLESFQFYWRGTSVALVSPTIFCTVVHHGQDIEKVVSILCDQPPQSDRSIHWINAQSFEMDRVDKLNHIQQVFKREQFELFCQPYMKLSGVEETKHSFEVLLRLKEQNGKVLSPAAFFPLINQFGLEIKLDHWVIINTFRMLGDKVKNWDDIGHCAINLTAKTLSAENLASRIIESAKSFNVPLEKICFEITESSALINEQQAIETLSSLRKLGCKVAIDDFGTGYASFAYLRRLPLDILKIEGAFVREITKSETDRLIVSSIATVAKEMHLETVAEFVETAEHSEILRSLGINFAQGYGVAKPMQLSRYLANLFDHQDKKEQLPAPEFATL
ncbi:sensor domain-containing phosphodiesterase [Vibrio harveyi]|uniref:sensor domain-containing phosphodiesterase n=1 Tax=Vibrio harveyi TaxID=669 RepID=UPI000DF1D914|nr:EAL domain-containing protein [Vibrio harveyi]RCR57871.1 EAL domain-containing protein [Vibrio harveyi]